MQGRGGHPGCHRPEARVGHQCPTWLSCLAPGTPHPFHRPSPLAPEPLHWPSPCETLQMLPLHFVSLCLNPTGHYRDRSPLPGRKDTHPRRARLTQTPIVCSFVAFPPPSSVLWPSLWPVSTVVGVWIIAFLGDLSPCGRWLLMSPKVYFPGPQVEASVLIC